MSRKVWLWKQQKAGEETAKQLVVMHHGEQILKTLTRAYQQLVGTPGPRDNSPRVNPHHSQRMGTGWSENRQPKRYKRAHPKLIHGHQPKKSL